VWQLKVVCNEVSLRAEVPGAKGSIGALKSDGGWEEGIGL